MTVIILTRCPDRLRGHLTRWLLEVSAGVYVGKISKRVREQLWLRIKELAENGRALMIYTSSGEQRFEVESYGHHWTPEDCDGVTLMRRPLASDEVDDVGRKPGWSAASRRRKFGGRK